MKKKRAPKHLVPHAVRPIAYAPGMALDSMTEVNRALALYRRSGNGVAAWAALAACIRHGRPIPDGLSEYFLHISDELVRIARTRDSNARRKIPALVLGSNVGGGKSVWSQYADFQTRQRIVEIIRRRMERRILDRPTSPWSQARVLEIIARRTGYSL